MRSGEAFEGILYADDKDSAIDVYRSFLGFRGYENLLIGAGSRSLVWDAPKGWFDYYKEEGFQFSDPVWRVAKHLKIPHTWETPLQLASTAERLMMKEAEASGLQSGISIPIYDGNELRLDISVSSKHHGVEAGDHLHEVAGVGYALAQRVFGAEVEPVVMVRKPLTPRERECIKWAAVGKTYNQIADIMGVRHRTVVSHVVNAMDKWGAANITSLCVMALISKEIDIPE